MDHALNAVVALDADRVLAEADEADGRRAGGETAPLLGLPVTIKDSIETEGLVSTGGSFARKGFVPERDATIVARLRACGAIVLAKTNLPEYQWSYETDNAIHGRTNNPLDLERTPGGSSGGEGALLGADASPVGIGSDGGGSIRVPAHYCGIVGIRPTTGLVPETGVWPETRSTGFMDLLSLGPLARYVEDLALALPLVAGPDWVDPYVAPVRLGEPADVAMPALRVGFYVYEGTARVTEGTRQAVEKAARALADRGCEVEEADVPDVSEATELFFQVMAADGGARARTDLAPAGGRHVEQMAQLLEDLRPLALTASEFFDVRRRFFDFRRGVRAFLARYDVVLSPVAPGCAPPHGGWPGCGVGGETYQAFNYSHVNACGGVPVAVVPAGKEEGMPIGVQIAARPYCDHVALAAAAALEEALGGFAAVRA